MLVLGLDTATAATVVGLHDGTRVLAERTVADARGHAEVLLPVLADVLAEAGATRRDLTVVACGVGPGPFTGLRVAVVTARVLGAVLGRPVAGVCTLDALAHTARTAGGLRGPLAVATDARRREVYWARYDETGHRTAGPQVQRPADVAALTGDVAVVGAGALDHPDLFLAARPPRWPSGGAVAGLVAAALLAGEPVPAAGRPFAVDDAHGSGAGVLPVGVPGVLLPAEPLYLRRPDARPPGAPKRVTAP